MSTIHRAFDPDRNWQSRLQAEEATRALSRERHRRNLRLAEFWTDTFAVVVLAVFFVEGLLRAYEAGIFSWVKF